MSKTENSFPLWKRIAIYLIHPTAFCIGSLMCLLQCFAYWTIYPINPQWYNNINYYLFYTGASCHIAMAYYLSNSRMNIRVARQELADEIFKPTLGLFIFNHSHGLDWFVCHTLLGDQLNMLGAYKAVIKSEVKYVPVGGWLLYFSRNLFVERSWAKDEKNFNNCLDELVDYNRTFLALFGEGTRFTLEKRDIANKYAEKKNLKPLHHHLIPKTKGFSHIVKRLIHMKQKQTDANREIPFKIYNVQVAFPTDLSLSMYFCNPDKFNVDVFIEEVPESKYKSPDSNLDQLLYDIYQRKDELFEQYRLNDNQFKEGFSIPYRRKMLPLIICLSGSLFVYSAALKCAIAYSCYKMFWLLFALIVGLLATAILSLEMESKHSRDKIVDKSKQ